MTHFLKKAIFHLILIFLCGSTISAQERYKDEIFENIAVETHTYSDTLQLDYYTSLSDTLTTKPLLLLVHGGGFATGKKDNPLEKNFSENMAKRGYAVASMSYRLLRKGKSFGCDCPAEEKIATFRAVTEDILKALQFLKEKSISLKFDPDKIILVGSSAGAEAVLNTAFMRDHYDFRQPAYGNIKFAGLISFAGAVVDEDYITSENMVPTLLFHGEKDQLVPFETSPHHYCANSATGYLILAGSSTIAKRIEELRGSYQLMYDPLGTHDWANLPYSRIEIISEFVRKAIIDREHIQAKIKIDP